MPMPLWHRYCLMLDNINLLSMALYGTNGCDMTVFKSKAGAISFAIMMCTTISSENGLRTVNYEEAQKLYDFINGNVNLPDVERDAYAEMMDCLPSLAGIAVANKDKTVPAAAE